jgi:hypothetical protein
MRIEPVSEASEAFGNRNFYHSIQAYVPWPLSFRHAARCDPSAPNYSWFGAVHVTEPGLHCSVGTRTVVEVAQDGGEKREGAQNR